MVFKRILASVGIGNTSVETVLNDSLIMPGEYLHGLVQLRGGSVTQTIDRIDLILEANAKREHDDMVSHETVRILHHKLLGPLTLEAGAMQELPFRVRVPAETPITRALGFDLNIPLYLRTEVEVAGAINPSDRDRVEVQPNRAQTRILEALDRLSFRLYKADLEVGRVGRSQLPFYQELEFKAGSNFHRSINELELTFIGREHDMDVVLEVDRKSWGRDDEIRSFNVRYTELDQNWERLIEGALLR